MYKVREIPAGQFKTHCLELMEEVNKTHVALIITKRGKPVAKLVPAYPHPRPVFGSMTGSVNIVGDIISPIDEKWQADE